MFHVKRRPGYKASSLTEEIRQLINEKCNELLWAGQGHWFLKQHIFYQGFHYINILSHSGCGNWCAWCTGIGNERHSCQNRWAMTTSNRHNQIVNDLFLSVWSYIYLVHLTKHTHTRARARTHTHTHTHAHSLVHAHAHTHNTQANIVKAMREQLTLHHVQCVKISPRQLTWYSLA